ncbi:hypothetical protein ACEPAI_4496 [Sanghuangporus weigelae]
MSSNKSEAVGEALDVHRLSEQFSGYNDALSDLHRSPCPACRELFSHGSVTQQDPGSGMVTEQLPPGYVMLENFAERNRNPMCASCTNVYNPTISNPHDTSQFCNSECEMEYYDYIKDNPNWPPAQQFTGFTPDSTTSQPQIPATVGYPNPIPEGYGPILDENHEFTSGPDTRRVPSWFGSMNKDPYCASRPPRS